MGATRTTDTTTPLTDEEVMRALDELEDAAPVDVPDVVTDTPDAAPAKTPRGRRARTPRKSAPAKPKADRAPRKPTVRATPLGKRVENAHATIALGLGMVPQPWAMPVAQSLALQAADIGKAWETLAKENPRVAETLERILTVSTVGALMGAYVPVVIAAVAASGKLPAGLGLDDVPVTVPAQAAPVA